MRPKSTWSSSPGQPSATRTVAGRPACDRRSGRRSAPGSAGAPRLPGGTADPDLGHGEVPVADPGPDLVGLGLEGPRGRPVVSVAMRADPLHHRQHGVGELFLPGILDHAGLGPGCHVAPDRLAGDPGQPLDRPQPSPRSKSTSLTSNTRTSWYATAAVLPPSPMAASAPGQRAGTGGSPGWSHDWRKGGPMLLAELSSGGPMLVAGDNYSLANEIGPFGKFRVATRVAGYSLSGVLSSSVPSHPRERRVVG